MKIGGKAPATKKRRGMPGDGLHARQVAGVAGQELAWHGVMNLIGLGLYNELKRVWMQTMATINCTIGGE